jgi:hypothetical protein
MAMNANGEILRWRWLARQFDVRVVEKSLRWKKSAFATGFDAGLGEACFAWELFVGGDAG